MKPHRGTLILVLGILSLVLGCAPLGIFAWVMGNTDLKEIAAGRMDPTGRSITQGGRICGIISTVLLGIGILVGCIVIVFAIIGAAVSVQH